MINARILADSLSPCGARLTTFVVTYPRFILAELNTHRQLSRNSASSRAVPLAKMLARVLRDPVYPVRWGANGRGMQDKGELPRHRRWLCRLTWRAASLAACAFAWLLGRLGLHKQVANRLLEPFSWTTTIVTATEWENFFALRAHPDAQPEFQSLARAMLKEYLASAPRELEEGEWHLPFGDRDATGMGTDDLLRVVTARCARVSYLNFEGKIEPEKDFALHDQLRANGHHCYDAETEVLTESGWKKWPSVVPDDRLASVDLSGGVRFESPASLTAEPYRGLMYELSGQQLDLMVTPNHRMVVSSRRKDGSWTGFRFEEASSVFGRPLRHRKSGELSAASRVPLDNPWGLPREVFARLVGFFVGDGWAGGGHNEIQFHLKRPRKIHFLKGIGVPVKERRGDRYVVCLPGIGDWFDSHCYGPDGQKKLPDSALLLTGDEVLALFDGLKNSDGSPRRRTWVYATTSRPLCGQIQAVAHLNNIVASVTVTDTSARGHRGQPFSYRLNFSGRLYPRVETGHEGRSLTYRESWSFYDGLVYCATVTGGSLMVRRGLKVAVCGNSPFEHPARAESTPARSGNFVGFTQYRKTIPGEARSLSRAGMEAILRESP